MNYSFIILLPESSLLQIMITTYEYIQNDLLSYQVESLKPTVLAINIAAKDSDTDPALREQIATMNQRWDRVCARAGVWQKELQIALLHSSEFRGTLQQLQDWIRNTEAQIRRLEPVHLEAPRAKLVEKYNRFRVSICVAHG